MYCPRCAAPNLDGAKFCRGCGTNLETVALALVDGGPSELKNKNEGIQIAKSSLEKRRLGVNKLIQGGGLLSASVLLGVALGVFSHDPDWIIIWLVLVGWMACFGVISIWAGVGALIESRFMLRQIGSAAAEPFVNTLDSLPADGGTLNPLDTAKLSSPGSITEHTTKLLPNQNQASE